MKATFTLPMLRTTLLSLALVALVWLLLARPTLAVTAHAVAGCSGQACTVTSCTTQGLADAMNFLNNNNIVGGLITFNCGPATIPITNGVGFGVTTGAAYTIDGGNVITLSARDSNGLSSNRLLNVQANAALTLTNITLRDGNSPGDNGGAVKSLGPLAIVSSRFFSNSAGSAWSGGAIESFGPLNISGSEFAHNSAGNGGALFPREPAAVTTISDSSFHDNSTTNTTNGLGGVMLVWNGAPVTADGTTFSRNQARSGGAIYLTSVSVLTLTNSTLSGNLATNGGGIFNALGGTARLSQSTLSGNYGGAFGGGIENDGMLTMTNSTLSGNLAPAGGGIDSLGTLTLGSSLISGNVATMTVGGGLNLSGAAEIDNSTFSGNSAADSGGALFIRAAAGATLANVTFSGNSANHFGGGIDNVGTLTLTGSILSGNTVTQTGGSVYNVGTATLNNSLLNHNSASIGGALANNIGTLTLNRSTLADNIASSAGGGIYSFGNINLNSSTVTANSAGNGGGGFYNDHSIANITNSTFSGNSTPTLGGGFYNSGQAIFYNVTLAHNSAASGGALYTQGSVPTVLTNTILAYSPSGGNCFGNVASSKYSLSSDNSCGLPPGNTIKGQNPNGLDPLLTALGNYGGPTQVHMIRANSPAKDGVVGSDAPAVDQRGLPRPGPDGSYDIGAVERQDGDSDLAPRLALPLIVR